MATLCNTNGFYPKVKGKKRKMAEKLASPDFDGNISKLCGEMGVARSTFYRWYEDADFVRYVDEGLDELNALFGEGSVRDFVWPYGEQNNAVVKAHIRATHRSSRKTGCTLDSTGFALPKDRYAWSYNADHMNLLEAMEKYESCADDGELKFFAFGVHSWDFERDSKWDTLSKFSEKYGDRPDDFWYASVGEIFDYTDAADQLVISGNGVYNPSSLPIYIIIGGRRETVSPLGVVKF